MKRIFFILSTNVLLNQVSAQNVGIGIVNPTRAKLEVHGAVGYTSGIFGGESSGISLQRDFPGIGFNQYHSSTGSKYMSNGYGAVQFLDPNTGYMAIDMFSEGSTDANTIYSARALTIGNNGNIGIKIAPINATLCVLKAGNFEGSAVFGGTSYNSHFNYSNIEDTYIRGGKAGSKVIINDIPGGKIIMGNGSSYVGINNGIPAYPLEVRQVNGKGILLVEPNNSFNNWELRVERYFGIAQESDLNLIYNGEYKGFFSAFTGSYIVYSDRRLKTGIAGMQPLLHKFMQLEPVEYEMKYHNANHEKTIGFIAQDVKQLFPQLVTITTDTSRGYRGITNLHGLNYNGFTVLTIKALQEQQQLIKKMQQQNTELSRRIEKAEAIINAEK